MFTHRERTGDRLQTILDEAFGPFETMPDEQLLTLLERKLFEQRAELEKLRSENDLHSQQHQTASEIISGLRAENAELRATDAAEADADYRDLRWEKGLPP